MTCAETKPIFIAKAIWQSQYAVPFYRVVGWHLEHPLAFVKSDSKIFLMARAVNTARPEEWAQRREDCDAWRVTMAAGKDALLAMFETPPFRLPKVAFCRQKTNGRLKVYDAARLREKFLKLENL